MEERTGRRAKDAVRAFDIPIPTFGKTGTANQFTNSAFVGFIPGPDPETGQLDPTNGYVIACYVGYDDNRPMKAEHFTIYGSSGALPLWMDTANAITTSEGYEKKLQLADLVFSSTSDLIPPPKGLKTVSVSPITGLPIKIFEGDDTTFPSTQIFGDVSKSEGTLDYKRHFEPIGGITE